MNVNYYSYCSSYSYHGLGCYDCDDDHQGVYPVYMPTPGPLCLFLHTTAN